METLSISFGNLNEISEVSLKLGARDIEILIEDWIWTIPTELSGKISLNLDVQVSIFKPKFKEKFGNNRNSL